MSHYYNYHNHNDNGDCDTQCGIILGSVIGGIVFIFLVCCLIVNCVEMRNRQYLERERRLRGEIQMISYAVNNDTNITDTHEQIIMAQMESDRNRGINQP